MCAIFEHESEPSRDFGTRRYRVTESIALVSIFRTSRSSLVFHIRALAAVDPHEARTCPVRIPPCFQIILT